jgi:hypothetical protein
MVIFLNDDDDKNNDDGCLIVCYNEDFVHKLDYLICLSKN